MHLTKVSNMGNTYFIHTEAKLNGSWKCIDGYYMIKHYGEDKERLTLSSTYENYSRSYFGSTYEKLQEIGNRVAFSELSTEVQSAHNGLRFVNNLFGENKEEESYVVVVKYNELKAHIPNGSQYHGVIHKNLIFEYEHGEIEDLFEDDEIDFSSLSDEEKKAYQYYEWDDVYDWPNGIKQIMKFVDITIEKYMMNAYEYDTPDVRIVCFVV